MEGAIFCSVRKTRELLQLYSTNEVLCNRKLRTYLQVFTIFFFKFEAFKYEDGAKFGGCVGTSAKSLCIESVNLYSALFFL